MYFHGDKELKDTYIDLIKQKFQEAKFILTKTNLPRFSKPVNGTNNFLSYSEGNGDVKILLEKLRKEKPELFKKVFGKKALLSDCGEFYLGRVV